jgi:glyoxylase-like metal-dependent hydrolase (beta-lactamase superfamily II)
MHNLTPVGDDLYQIDAFMHDAPRRLAVYVYDTPSPVVIESGPSRSLHHVIDALDAAGIEPSLLLLTHIHLDHAGGAGQFSARFPDAIIGVHPIGARHLVSPERLWKSAARIYGEQHMEELYGPMVPVEEARIRPLDEGDVVDLGSGRRLDIMYTPGHASHHITPFDPGTGVCFVGDVAGIRFPSGPFAMPVTPPPDFDPDLIAAQLHRIAALEPSLLAFAHFGTDADVDARLTEAERETWWWVEIARRFRDDPERATAPFRTAALDRLRSLGASEVTVAEYDVNTFWPMQPTGIFRWLDQHGS